MANAAAALQQVVPSTQELSYLAEQYACLLTEKRDLTSHLNKALDENAALNQLYTQTCGDFDRERIQLNSEIANLRSQLSSRLQSIVAIKEKLMREEFERKFQELTLEVRQERHRYKNAIADMKRQIAKCICQVRNH
jgi:F0F1-type ATP synthase membrane subunit b/b'